MSKDKVKVLQIETIIIAVLIICTLFQLLSNKFFTAGLLLVTAITLSRIIKKKRVLRINKKKILIVLIVFAISYLALFYVLGIYTGFYKQTHTFGIDTIINYIIPITIIIISTEIIRDRLLVDSSFRSKTSTVIIGTIIDISLYLDVYGLNTIEGFLALLGFVTFASIANNLLFTYISDKFGKEPVIAYKLITYLYIYIIPFAPDVYIFFRAFVRMIYPLIIYTYLDKYYDLDREVKNARDMRSQMVSLLGSSVIMVIIIALISCNFLFGVLVIGSESMSHSIDKGDVILYKRSNGDIKAKDVIVFERDDMRIVHRAISVKNINHELRIYTKGDANKQQDEGYVTKENLKGKVLFRIRYIGKPTLWLREFFNKEG